MVTSALSLTCCKLTASLHTCHDKFVANLHSCHDKFVASLLQTKIAIWVAVFACLFACCFKKNTIYRSELSSQSSAASVACGKRKRRIEEENREFNQDWTESFAFICNTDGLPTCLLCHEKLAHNKKSNLERHFTTKHTQFADESCDIKDTAQVTLFVRYVSSQGPKELLGLLPLSGQTRGEDVANAVQNCLEDNGIDINKIASIATDGARSMTGIHRGVTSILQKKINHRGYAQWVLL
ncbi:hypothetical protein AVEN_171016-1 [Araneus ventricosus]|uniref:DUF4371 domain-containing protein n=1 Tax=Araneus ventricosus TaxID=182803 RepID=A0A4Y2B775_ARAVE|nr:hypothetical protein AVEN_171016-1 [Araneus ventricosus]